jgi:hypothetical protein
MILKYFKWLLPVFTYPCYGGIAYLLGKIDVLIYGFRPNDGPTVLPDWAVIFILFHLVPLGYILLVIAHCLYWKKKEWFKIFVYLTVALFTILCIIPLIQKIIRNEQLWPVGKTVGHYLLINLPPLWGYFAIFFVSLYYILKCEKEEEEEECC